MRMKPVKAWAVVYDDGGPMEVTVNHAAARLMKKHTTGVRVKLVPVRIVPESEYRRMMAAVKELEAIKNTSEAQPYTGGRVVRHGNDWKKGKVKRG